MKLFESRQKYFPRIFREAHQIAQASCRQNFPENYREKKIEEKPREEQADGS
ncbi:unnamed protein product [marine sediment metagenome]|uniref:Uncharacterized protein n=1 Tax=marine sediment metagenome TaxID=412755 RepID=X0XMX8_9ZZZZ